MSWNEESDRMVDEALAEYREAEPLAGLEERVLHRLDAQAEPRRSRSWRWNAAALAVAGLLLAAWLGWRDWSAGSLPGKHDREAAHALSPDASQNSSHQPSSAQTHPDANYSAAETATAANRAGSRSLAAASAQSEMVHRAPNMHATKDDAALSNSAVAEHPSEAGASLARQEQFPSVAPLTQEERALMAMLQQSPAFGQAATMMNNESPRGTNRGLPSTVPGSGDASQSPSSNDISKNPKIQIDPIEITPLSDHPTGDF